MTRCSCTACLLKAALELLHSGRVSMGVLLVEQALEQVEQSKPVKLPARRTGRARP
jgi:hypothetical protein